MQNQQPQEHILDVVNGDIGLSRALRQSLLAIRSSVSDQHIRSGIDDVLAGRTGMREFSSSETFSNLFDQGASARIDSLTAAVSADDRTRLAAQAEILLERLRQAPTEVAVSPETVNGHIAVADPQARAADQSVDRGAPPSITTVHPGTRKPDRERVVLPDEPDEDDLYFQERRQRGWLE